MATGERTVVTVDLGEAKKSVAAIGKATKAPSRAETIRQIFLQIEREQKRLGIQTFSYGDVTINPRQ